MKKIIISFFVFGLMFFVGHFANAQKVDASAETALVEISSQNEVVNIDTLKINSSDITEPETIGEPFANVNSLASSDWTYVGLPGFSAGDTSSESMDIDSNNTPFVVYQDTVNGNRATVMKFNGTSWVNVGNPGFSAGAVEYASLVLDSSNTPYVAYRDNANGGKATVMKFNGTSWIPVGNPGFSAGIAAEVSLALDSNNVPYVSYEDAANNIMATVMKFNGTSWVNVGNPGFSAGAVLFPSIAIGPNNIPYVAYSDDAYGQKATVMKFNGTDWVNVGNPGFSLAEAHFITLAVDGNNTPYVVYSDVGTGGNMYRATSKKFNGNSWVDVGNPAGFSTDYVSSISLKIDSNNVPYVAYRDHQNLFNPKATVMKYNGTNWASVGNTCFSTNNIGAISLALNSSDIPYVAFADLMGSSSKATVMKYNPVIISLVTITSPNGGGSFTAGNQFTATWSSAGFQSTDNLSFDLVYQTTGTHYSLTTSTPNDGTEIFTIPLNIPAGQYKLYCKFLNTNIEDYSDNSFTVVVPNNSDWVNVGNPGFSASYAFSPSFAIGSNDVLYVAYSDYANGSKATVMKFDGTNWIPVGNPGFSAYAIQSTSIAMDSNNFPYIAYTDGVSLKATVMKFNGTNWVVVGTSGFSTGNANPSIAIDTNNVPYVVYADGGDNFKATVMKFDGTNWVYVGVQGFSGSGQIGETSIAIGSNNIPYVSYIEFGMDQKATVMKFDGTNWVYVGVQGFSGSSAPYLSLALDLYNIPYVTFRDVLNGSKATVMKFNGTSWVNIGNAGFSAGWITDPVLSFNSNNTPYVSYTDVSAYSRITTMKFDGTNWVNVGMQGFSPNASWIPSLVIDSYGVPYVLFQDADDGKVTVMKYIQIAPSITITSPNGGESFTHGQQFTATWTTTGIPATDELYFGLIQDVTNIYYILTGSTLNDGTEVFTIPSNILPGQYRMYGRKPNTAIDDFSDNSFTIN